MKSEDQIQAEEHPWITEPSRRLAANPLDAQAFYNRAVGYSNFNLTGKAIADYTSAIKINPHYKEAYEGRAFAYEAINEAEKAAADRQCAAETGELPTRRLIAELSGKIEAAAAFDPQTAYLYRSRGSSLANLREFEPAIADYTVAVQIQPDDVEAYYERSQIYCRLNQIEKAIADLTRIIEINPDNTFIRRQRAGAFLNLKQYEKAIRDFTRLIEIEPDNDSAFNNRAAAYAAIGEDGRAAADLERAAVIKAEKPLKEIINYTALIEAGSDEAEVLSGHYAERGSVYYGIGEFAKAIADYTRAIELDPDYEDLYFMRANAYEEIGETAKAAADRKHLIEG